MREAIRKVSRNYTRPCFVLKCDIRKFFDTVDHETLLLIIKGKIRDKKTIRLMENIVGSYSTAFTRETTLALLYHLNPCFAPSTASRSSSDNSCSLECFFKGLPNMLTCSREYRLEMSTPSPSSFRNAVAKL